MIDQIAKYWDKQAGIWKQEKQQAWHEPETTHWLHFFRQELGEQPLDILELGTASGYFSFILSQLGHRVRAIDLSPAMIVAAKEEAIRLNYPIDFQVMDMQNLAFKSNTMDVVFTRLATWILPDVESSYRECFRVLRPGGILINFDGDFGKCQFSQEGHEMYPEEIMEEANQIKAQLEINWKDRPEYDLEILRKIGFEQVMADSTKQNEILKRADSGLFMIKALKSKK